MHFSVTAPRVSGVAKRSRRVQEIVMLTLIEETGPKIKLSASFNQFSRMYLTPNDFHVLILHCIHSSIF